MAGLIVWAGRSDPEQRVELKELAEQGEEGQGKELGGGGGMDSAGVKGCA